MEAVTFLFKYAIFFVIFLIVAVFLTERKIHFFGLFLVISSIIIFFRYQSEGLRHLPPVAVLLFLSGMTILVYNYKTDKDDYIKPRFKDYFDILFKSNENKPDDEADQDNKNTR